MMISSVSFQLRNIFQVCKPCAAYFQTSAAANIRKKIPRKSYTELPQPILKPIGPEDYNRWKFFLNQPKFVPQVQPTTPKDESLTNNIISLVNEEIVNQTCGRLFAIVHIASKQFKITTEDIIVIQGYFEPEIGSVIKLEKVLLVGSSNFTLVGRPLLEKNLVHVEATVMEKTLSYIMTKFEMRRRKRFRRINFSRMPFTMLRINEIRLKDRIH